MNDVNPPAPILQERRPIPGYEGLYEMDRAGNVYALFDSTRGLKAGRVLSQCRDKSGYVKVTLRNGDQSRQQSVHRLLMLTFCPVENSADLDVNHIDGNKSNNDLSNLEWLTHRENMHHALNVLGKWIGWCKGETANGSKLKEADVREIYRLHKQGWSNKQLGEKFGVSGVNITYIIHRKIWRHLDLE